MRTYRYVYPSQDAASLRFCGQVTDSHSNRQLATEVMLPLYCKLPPPLSQPLN